MYFTMRLGFIFVIIPLLLTSFGISEIVAQEEEQPNTTNMSDYYTVLNDTQGMPTVMVSFLEEADYGTMIVMIQGRNLRSGWHTMSLSSDAVCDTDQEFQNDGEVYNPADEQFPYRSGDMIPLYVMRDGTVAMSYRTDQFNQIGDMGQNGFALVISEGLMGVTGSEPRDDMRSEQMDEGDEQMTPMPADDRSDQSGTDGMQTEGIIACGVLMQGSPPSDVFVIEQPQEDQNGMMTDPDEELDETDEQITPTPDESEQTDEGDQEETTPTPDS